MISITEVQTGKQLSDFIRFPDMIYAGNRYRVPQLHMYEKMILGQKSNPAFEFCEAKYWLAYENGKLAGRIAGIINHRANELSGEKVARFGWIDFVDNNDVSAALIAAVESWGRSKGMTKAQGPMGFTDMDLEGMLVEGFEEVGTQAVIYNYPYYPVHLEQHGYRKEVDWIQYEVKIPSAVPEKVKRVSEIVQRKYGLRPLKARKAADLLPYARKMFDTLNVSFGSLYGFVPLNERQVDFYVKQYFSMINPAYTCFVLDHKDEVAGFGVSMASLSQAMIKARGKLYPTGFIHMLRAMWKNDKADMLLQGVKPEYQNKGVPAIFASELIQSYIKNGIKTAISSHVLESNLPSLLIFKDYERRQHLRRRCFHKPLDQS